ncbi:Abi family protein [Planktosalinus lacus]|uniref:CAAX amino protease n=1 Tax=Planktosalinus lacus TaxID=1526573 RepID=A0A8J2V8D2_9FLAO|nr:Abi family protein [Planktosalinus lacus]GGD86444.1 CAAX amino protease [Planktosalinus lacus]
MSKEDYPKNILTIDNQIKQLKQRGLVIEDDNLAKQYLKNISYFRLQGFWWELQADKKKHLFKKGTTFETVVSLYTFDRKLRLLIFDAIERIEVALRTKMIYYISIENNNWWWYENKNLFFNMDFFEESIKDIDKELNRSKEVFIETHFENYGSQDRPPCYKTFEILSLGTLSKIYGNLKNDLDCKKRLAIEFDLPNENFLKSWMNSFNVVRNICAHHSRLWNRNIHIPPKQLSKPNSNFILIPNNDMSVYYSLSCIIYILNKVSPGHTTKESLVSLFNNNPDRLAEMGFSENWRNQLLWA